MIKKASRIKYKYTVDGYNRENWPEIIKWLVTHLSKLEKAFKSPLAEINNNLRQSNFEASLTDE